MARTQGGWLESALTAGGEWVDSREARRAAESRWCSTSSRCCSAGGGDVRREFATRDPVARLTGITGPGTAGPGLFRCASYTSTKRQFGSKVVGRIADPSLATRRNER